jgi:CBS domain-containing protein
MAYKASSVMNTSVISISSEALLENVVKVLADKKISGLPVVDADNKLVGIITETDIVKFATKLHVVPVIGTSGWISPHMDVSDMNKFKKGFELLGNTKVKKVMSKKPVTVTEDININEIARLMKKKNINRIPVMDKEGRIAGIIARADLVNFLAEREGQGF